jgi:hypothetical protein
MGQSKKAKDAIAFYMARQEAMKELEKITIPPLTIKVTKDKDEDEEKIELSLPLDPTIPMANWNSSNIMKKTYPTLKKNGTAADYCRTLLNVDSILALSGQQENFGRKVAIFRRMLDVETGEKWDEIYATKQVDNESLDEDDQLEEEAIFKMALNELAKEFFMDWSSAYRKQKRYMRSTVIPKGMTSNTFCNRLAYINRCLPYFPYNEEKRNEPFDMLPEDELVDIVDSAKRPIGHPTCQGKRKLLILLTLSQRSKHSS